LYQWVLGYPGHWVKAIPGFMWVVPCPNTMTYETRMFASVPEQRVDWCVFPLRWVRFYEMVDKWDMNPEQWCAKGGDDGEMRHGVKGS
jgi:hypothetical protein